MGLRGERLASGIVRLIKVNGSGEISHVSPNASKQLAVEIRGGICDPSCPVFGTECQGVRRVGNSGEVYESRSSNVPISHIACKIPVSNNINPPATGIEYKL